MKTINQIKSDLIEVVNTLQEDKQKKVEDRMKKSAATKLRKKIPFLKTCIMYVESGPSEQFVKKEIERIETKINLRMGLFILDDYKEVDKKTVSKFKREHEKKYEIPHLREQVRTLRFLLK